MTIKSNGVVKIEISCSNNAYKRRRAQVIITNIAIKRPEFGNFISLAAKLDSSGFGTRETFFDDERQALF